jgi:hypothetical protein
MATIEFCCPECNTFLEADASGTGQSVNCPQCGKSMRIPASMTSVVPDIPPPPANQPPLPSVPPPQATQTPSPAKQTPPPARTPATPASPAPGRPFPLVQAMIVVAVLGLLAAIAIPSFVKAREESQKNACINNLRQMDAAKEQAGLVLRWKEGQEINKGSQEEQTALQYIKGSRLPVCPAGGIYMWRPIGKSPMCSLPKHKLPY